MAKHPKSSGDKAETSSDTVLDEILDTLRFGLGEIRSEIEKIKSGKSKSDKHDKASRIAFLTGKVGQIADSVRKVEAARAKRLDAITPAIVLAWFRAQDQTERARLVRELQQLDSGRSGLA